MAKATDQSKTGYVTVATVRSRAEARQLAAKLESAGIDSLLTVERAGESASAKYRWFNGVKVQVSRTDVQRALHALQQSRAQEDKSAPRERKSELAAGSSPCQLNLGNWQEAVIAVCAIIAVAALLALWLF
ncbi:MAG: hypothetical protein HW419_3103 [Deltaproteobacteria bacterium]|nr:hypothetical protein [Deltaproteobacteria bacterium]